MLILLGLYGIQALFHPGLYSAHDIWHQVARLYHYSAAVSDGSILPTWISTLANGYGYPLFYFSYHLPWLMGLPFIWLGFSIFSTLKILFGLSFVLAGYAMYWLALTVFKNRWAALAVAAIYLISPYHFLSIFVSASIGTVFQFALLPLIILGLIKTINGEKYGGVTLLASATAASILSHLMTFVLMVPFLIIIGVLLLLKRISRPKQILPNLLSLSLSALIALGLSAFYLIPTFLYLPLVRAGDGAANFQSLYQGGFVTLKQLFYSTWGFAPIAENAATSDLSFQVGISQWLAVASSGIMIILYFAIKFVLMKQSDHDHYSKSLLFLKRMFDLKFLSKYWPTGVTMIALFSLSIWLMLSASSIVWDVIAQYFTLDYPFRYLIMAVFFASLLAGLVIASLRNHTLQMIATFVLILIALYTNRNHLRVNMYTTYELSDYIGAELTTNTYHEYLPLEANSGYLLAENPQIATNLQANIQTDLLYESSTRLGLAVNASGPADLVALRQYNFPGQTVYLNGEKTEHTTGDGNLIQLSLPTGFHTIEVEYQHPPVYYLSLSISVATLIFTCLLTIRKPK